MSVIPYCPGLQIGQGFNPETGILHNQAIEWSSQESIIPSPGVELFFSLQSIESSAELARSLDISASASLSKWGVEGSMEAKVVNSSEINSNDLFMLFNIVVKYQDQTIKDPRLKPAISNFLNNPAVTWQQAQKLLGPWYVCGVRTGGALYAMIHIVTSNKSESRELAGKLKFSGYGVTASGEVKQRLESNLSNRQVEIQLAKAGGIGEPLKIELDELVQTLLKFPVEAKANPVPTNLILAQYEATIQECLEKAEHLEDGAATRQHNIDTLSNRYLEYKDLHTMLCYVSEKAEKISEYQDYSSAQILELRNKIKEDRSHLTNVMNKITAKLAQQYDSATPLDITSELEHELQYTPKTTLPDMEGQDMTLAHLSTQVNALSNKIVQLESQSAEIKVLRDKITQVDGQTMQIKGLGDKISQIENGSITVTRAANADHAARATTSDSTDGIANGTIQGNLTVTGELTCSKLICSHVTSPGRLHLASQTQDVYILTGEEGENKEGSVYVDCAWGGSGRLFVNQKEVQP